MNDPKDNAPRYLHIIVDTPEEYFIAVFTGFVDEIPIFKRVVAEAYIFENDLKPAADCAQELNRRFPAMFAVTNPSRKKKKGETK